LIAADAVLITAKDLASANFWNRNIATRVGEAGSGHAGGTRSPQNLTKVFQTDV
jgi:hypothetical protein